MYYDRIEIIPRHYGCVQDQIMNHHRSEAHPILFLPLLSTLLELAVVLRVECSFLDRSSLLAALESTDLGVAR
jgi:hypothetical protein